MSPQEKYRVSCDEDDGVSEESVAFLEDNPQLARSRPRQNQWSRLFATTICYVVACCLSIVLFEIGKTRLIYLDKTINRLPGRDLMPYFPHNQVVKFEPNEVYAGNRSSKAWQNLNAEGGGWITVEHGEQLGLGPPIRYNNKEGYGVSVFHQLHCLAAMHDAYLGLLSGGEGRIQHAQHVEHCFDYIRQVLMCHADLGLEHRRHEGEGIDNDSTDGWGALHQCRDWNAVVQFVEEKALTKGWIPPDNFKHGHHHGNAGTADDHL